MKNGFAPVQLSLEQIAQLERSLANTPPTLAFAQSIGNTHLAEGLWRFYSASWPAGVQSPWRSHWLPFLPGGFFSFGEDVFGNQLAVVDGCENMLLWDHENGELHDLFVTPPELLSTALQSGIDWIDFYSDGSLSVARQHGPVPLDQHLHWTTPLILGGSVSRENLCLVERESHLMGHAQLWSQISESPPGTTIIPG